MIYIFGDARNKVCDIQFLLICQPNILQLAVAMRSVPVQWKINCVLLFVTQHNSSFIQHAQDWTADTLGMKTLSILLSELKIGVWLIYFFFVMMIEERDDLISFENQFRHKNINFCKCVFDIGGRGTNSKISFFT